MYKWIEDYPTLPTEETCRFVDELRKNDSQELRDKIILGNVRLVLFKASAYVKLYRQTLHLKDDMVSAGFVGLTNAVNFLADPGASHTESVSGLMSLFIHREIGGLIERSNLIVMPLRTKIRNNLKEIKVNSFSEHDYDLPSNDCSDDLREVIWNLTETEYERQILSLRESGFTDLEISARLDLPASTINLIRRELFNQFKALV